MRKVPPARMPTKWSRPGAVDLQYDCLSYGGVVKMMVTFEPIEHLRSRTVMWAQKGTTASITCSPCMPTKFFELFVSFP